MRGLGLGLLRHDEPSLELIAVGAKVIGQKRALVAVTVALDLAHVVLADGREGAVAGHNVRALVIGPAGGPGDVGTAVACGIYRLMARVTGPIYDSNHCRTVDIAKLKS